MLKTLLDSTRRRLDGVVARQEDFESIARALPPARSFAAALSSQGLGVIAEVKRRSPSAGPIALDLDPATLAAAYERGGAVALSVLTEPDHFAGSLEDLKAVRTATTLPVLRKDFTLHPAQIWEARAAGADAVLLIVAAVTSEDLAELLETARLAGVTAIVEAHQRTEVVSAVSAGATVVGVNNRDLRTFVTDLAVAESMASELDAADVISIAESGVSSEEGARRMATAGYDAILVGEAAVRSSDPAVFISSLVEAGR